MSLPSQVADCLQTIWVVDSDRWYSTLRWQFASSLPHVRHQRIRPTTLFEFPQRMFQLANGANTPLIIIFEMEQASLLTFVGLMPEFELNLPGALFLAVGDPELEVLKSVMRFTGIADFYSRESDLRRMLSRVKLFQSSSKATKLGVLDGIETDKSLSGLVNQIKHPLRFIFDHYDTQVNS